MAAARKSREGGDVDLPSSLGDAGQTRTCAVTRAELDASALIRFVVSPDGHMVPDLGRRLPGRGVWVTADAKTLAEAIKTKAFSRSLKRPVIVDESLIAAVRAQIERRVMDYLGLANKAGTVTFGFQQIDGALEKGLVKALLHGRDAADGGRQKLDRKFEAVSRAGDRKAIIIDFLSIEQMSLAMGRTNVVHAALSSGGLTQRFILEAERFMRFEASASASGTASEFSNNEG